MILSEIFFLLFGVIVLLCVMTLSGTWSTWRQCFDDGELRQEVEGRSCGVIEGSLPTVACHPRWLSFEPPSAKSTVYLAPKYLIKLITQKLQ